MNLLASFLIATLALAARACVVSNIYTGWKSYDRYQIIRMNLSTFQNFEILRNRYFKFPLNLDFWTPPRRRGHTEAIVCPENLHAVKGFLSLANIPYEVTVLDLGKKVKRDRERYFELLSSNRDGDYWAKYQRLNTIYRWMDDMELKYPDNVAVKIYGHSVEKRDLKSMIISSNLEDIKKPIIWIDGGIHGNEWISTATVFYVANRITNMMNDTYGIKDPEIRDIVRTFEWHIVPVMNPDGYEFSHSTDRLWRKNRSGNGISRFFGCQGTDLNRNWDFDWRGERSTGNPCSNYYRGEKEHSEPEVEQVQNHVLDKEDRVKMFLTFQSFGQLIVFPRANNLTKTSDYSDLRRVAVAGANAIEKVYGTKYTVGTKADMIEPVSGASIDWAKQIANITFAFEFHLRDKGKDGFLLPPKQIRPSGKETFQGVVAMAKEVKNYYNL